MKVAIIGAGLSGLSCAYELSKYNINAVLYEKKSYLGDSLDYTIATLRMFNHFYTSPKRYFKKQYKLKVMPINTLKRITMISANEKTTIKGNLGWIFLKSRDKASIENQIASQFNPDIRFESLVNINDLKNKYDYIVCANGDDTISRTYPKWKNIFKGYIRVSTVIGNFDPNHITMWLNTKYARNCYAYMLPYNNKKATISLSVNDITYPELDHYWKTFINTEDIDAKILETRDREISISLSPYSKIDNVFFVGNSGGFMCNFLGLGAIEAIESGIAGGKCIAHNLDFNQYVKPILQNVKGRNEYKKILNEFSNINYDNLIRLLGNPFIKQLTYKNPFYKGQITTTLVRLYNKYNNNE